jgi:hypothetical protein
MVIGKEVRYPVAWLYSDEISGRIARCTQPLFICSNSGIRIYSFKCYFYMTFTYLIIYIAYFNSHILPLNVPFV